MSKRYETAANRVESLIELMEQKGVLSAKEADTLRVDDVEHTRRVKFSAREGIELPAPAAERVGGGN